MKTTTRKGLIPRGWFCRVRAGLERQLRIIVLLSCLCTVAGFFGAVALPFELLSHFRIQYCVLQLLGCTYFSAVGRWLALIFTASFLAVNASLVLPWYYPAAEPPTDNSAARLRILLSNVHTTNRRYPELIRLIEEEEPDVVALLEVDRSWIKGLRNLAARYPFASTEPRDDNFGIAVYSRVEGTRFETVYFAAPGIPSIAARFGPPGSETTLLATHTLPPVSLEYFGRRNSQLESIARFSALRDRMIVIGDLNVTMWSPFHSRLIKLSGLRNTREGFGARPTWPIPLLPLMIPIDHCLVSSDLFVAETRVATSVGSDHLPLIVDLLLPWNSEELGNDRQP